jgi:hypothetical protein
VVSVVAAFAIGASLAGGIALAAPSSGRTLHACANPKGVLHVLKPNGQCATHFSPVTLNRRGVRGATGSKGKLGHVGPRGPNGLSGAGAASSDVADPNGSGVIRKGQLIPVAGTSLHVQAQCLAARTTAWSRVAILGGDHYAVHGFSHFIIADTVSAVAQHENAAGVSTSDPIGTGPRLIGFTNSFAKASAVSDVEVIGPNDTMSEGGTGRLSANLLAVDGHTTFTVAVYLAASNDASPSTCNATAQVTAAS